MIFDILNRRIHQNDDDVVSADELTVGEKTELRRSTDAQRITDEDIIVHRSDDGITETDLRMRSLNKPFDTVSLVLRRIASGYFDDEPVSVFVDDEIIDDLMPGDEYDCLVYLGNHTVSFSRGKQRDGEKTYFDILLDDNEPSAFEFTIDREGEIVNFSS